jgi:hypothetical protein
MRKYTRVVIRLAFYEKKQKFKISCKCTIGTPSAKFVGMCGGINNPPKNSSEDMGNFCKQIFLKWLPIPFDNVPQDLDNL